MLFSLLPLLAIPIFEPRLLPKKGLEDSLAVAILLFTGLLLRPAGNKEDARTDR